MHLNMKLFVSTFILIFLAELGDKTQLAAMARSIEGRWTVFLAASCALVCSTLIAVLCGDLLTRMVPERYLQAGAGVLFIVFGLIMLVNVLRAEPAEVKAKGHSGRFAQFVAQTAIAFEEAAEQDYRRLAELTGNDGLRHVLLALADEEKAHAKRLRQVSWTDGPEIMFDPVEQGTLPELEHLMHDVAQDEAAPVLDHAIEHELATAAFYDAIARTAKLPGIKTTLHTLAIEERNHAERLRALK